MLIYIAISYHIISQQHKVVLDSFVDKHRGHVFQFRADPECVAESARSDTQDTPSLGVERRKAAKLTVCLARLARVQVVSGLQHARVVRGRRRRSLRRCRRCSVNEPLLTFCTNTAVVILSFRRYSLKPKVHIINNGENTDQNALKVKG